MGRLKKKPQQSQMVLIMQLQFYSSHLALDHTIIVIVVLFICDYYDDYRLVCFFASSFTGSLQVSSCKLMHNVITNTVIHHRASLQLTSEMS